MGLLDGLESMVSERMGQQAGAGGNNGQVAGGLLGALEEHPGGLAGMMQTMQHNGVDANAMTNGQPTSPEQVQQGLGPSGIIDKVAARTGLSPEMVKIGMATALPIIMAHMTQGGTQAPPSSGAGSMASEILGKFL